MAEVILIVDDEPDILNLVKRFILREKYDVLTAESGEEALGKISKHKVDLMILDINLPGIDGWEVCRKVRSSPTYNALPIIMLTIRSSDENKTKGYSIGADEYMSKPFTRKELVTRIKTVLKRTGS